MSYITLDLTDNGFLDNTQVYHGAAGRLFHDGRQPRQLDRQPGASQVGYVPFENSIGKAQIIFFSIRGGTHAWEIWRWPWTVRWSRLFTLVR